MKNYTNTFFIILAESLVIFIMFGIFSSDDNTSRWLLLILCCSFLVALISVLYSKLMYKFEEKHYNLMLILKNLCLANMIYIIANMLGYATIYVSFMIQYTLLALITYHINKFIYIKQINELNDMIKKSKQINDII